MSYNINFSCSDAHKKWVKLPGVAANDVCAYSIKHTHETPSTLGDFTKDQLLSLLTLVRTDIALFEEAKKHLEQKYQTNIITRSLRKMMSDNFDRHISMDKNLLESIATVFKTKFQQDLPTT